MISITIEDNDSVSIKTTKGVVETEIAATIVVEAMRNLKKQGEAIPKEHALYLQNCGDTKLQCVKAVKENLFLGLKEAKDICDAASCGSKPEIARSLNINYLNRLKRCIEESGATCFIDKQ